MIKVNANLKKKRKETEIYTEYILYMIIFGAHRALFAKRNTCTNNKL